jgi:hypothetical protein
MTYRQLKRLKAESALGKRMANARWAQDRARRTFLAEHDPCVTGRVVRRIIDIAEETGTMTEIVIRDFDSVREMRRKLAGIGLTLSTRKV